MSSISRRAIRGICGFLLLVPAVSTSLRGASADRSTIWLDELDLMAAQQGWGTPRRSRAVDGGPVTIAGRHFDRGFGTHSPGTLVVSLRRGAQRFAGYVGLDDEVSPNRGSAEFRILGDGRILWSSGVMRTGEAAKPFDVDVHAVRILVLDVADGGDSFAYDHSDWADARFEGAAVRPVTVTPRHAQPVIAVPADGGKPSIHAPTVVGVRPNTDLVFRIPAIGLAPLAYSVVGLPAGVTLNPKTGILAGRPKRAGDYHVRLRVRNARGEAVSTLRLKVGSALALTPPLGWNSYDAFGDSVTEAEFMANERYVAKRLAPHGWRFVVVDYRWYGSAAKSGAITVEGSRILVDPYGRPQPAPNRFPSSANGKGFKALADRAHAQGLLFGIHLMRGIPRVSVDRNLPIFGSRFRASDAANTADKCGWCTDMYGVRGDTEAGQAWYNSIMRQYAAWGVDYLKIDDLSSPYATHEIEAIRRALDRCGRSIVFSTSPGATPVAEGKHIASHANAWRISGDLWDNWADIDRSFELGAAWAPFAGTGHFPDADMLPLGDLAIRSVGSDRRTHLNRNEQVTMLTLWSMIPSPLMLGGNQPDNDPWTVALITNDEVLDVNQDPGGKPAKRIRIRGGLEAWVRPLADGSRAVALFNRGALDESLSVTVSELGIAGRWSVRDLWRRKDLPPLQSGFRSMIPSHGAVFLRLTPMRVASKGR